jgi:hypothetical protein
MKLGAIGAFIEFVGRIANSTYFIKRSRNLKKLTGTTLALDCSLLADATLLRWIATAQFWATRNDDMYVH